MNEAEVREYLEQLNNLVGTCGDKIPEMHVDIERLENEIKERKDEVENLKWMMEKFDSLQDSTEQVIQDLKSYMYYIDRENKKDKRNANKQEAKE